MNYEKNIFKENSLKSTKKRNLIIKIINDYNTPITAENIFKIASKEIKINISTIYRTLNILCEKKIIEKSIHQNGISYFSIKNNIHSHSIICNICNKKINLNNCPIQKLENDISNETGCIITGHNLEFFGICPKCIKNM